MTEFQVAESDEGLVELIDADTVRINMTFIRAQHLQFRKDCPTMLVDLGQVTAEGWRRLILYGLKQHCTDGAPSKDGTRVLSGDEKRSAAEAHCATRLDILYGKASMQARGTSADPLAEEMRKLVLRILLKKGKNRAELPAVLKRSAKSVDNIAGEAAALGFSLDSIEAIMAKAEELVAAQQIDDLILDLDI